MGTVARYAEILPITQIIVWIPLSNTIYVKIIVYQKVADALDACHVIQISLLSANWKLCTLQNLQVLLMKLYTS